MRSALLSTLFLVFAARVVADTITCDADNLCPEETPCCSQYGECGTGSYCLGGCDPRFSYEVDSCAPQPICESGTYTFEDLSQLQENTVYLGNASATPFVYTGYPLSASDNLLVTMPNQTTGTVVYTSRYMWYGNVTVTMKSSRGAGVVSAFILYSDVEDEIDNEFVGADLEDVQTNYYYQGILDWTNAVNVSLTDTYSNWHTYAVNWTEESLTWYVDGQVGRVLYKADTYNSTSGEYSYPQTPSRVELSIWPGGLSSNAPGTIEWAGGEIDWDSEDIQEYGYDYALIKEVDIVCYSPPSFANQTGTSYRYINRNGTQESVIITNDTTILASSDATGTDMDAGSSSSAVSSSAASSTTASSSASIVDVSEISQSSTVMSSSGVSSSVASSSASIADVSVVSVDSTATSSSAASSGSAASTSAASTTSGSSTKSSSGTGSTTSATSTATGFVQDTGATSTTANGAIAGSSASSFGLSVMAIVAGFFFIL
ncbi:concanavalin A-like lectin/glucanase domain-containing protein [Limtongia smithiae]|uniref:concanavalin A-like lectin/glucanase domain-containing protein n=1 Tax=Limtongia smithiae TaxID=1125753 RepID=UPI0034CD070F